MSETTSIALFSYGTLRQAEVQIANYGRLLEGEPDVLSGYRLEPVEIVDPDVVRISGMAVHRSRCQAAIPGIASLGVVFALTEAEIAATDAYETDTYARVEIMLESGRSAWVYVAA